jgi:hypothetical protein
MRKSNTKLITLIFSIFIIQFSILNAQDTWIQTYQPFGDVDYYPEDIVVCQDGGYVVNGYYFVEETWDEWGFLMKTDSDGNFLWAHLDTPDFLNQTHSNAFVETSDGDFISAGWDYISTNYLLKRDSEGNELWSQPYDFGVNSMCITSDGNIVLGGNLGGIALRKIDEEGNEIWTKSYQMNENYSVCKSIIQTRDGGFALAGYGYFESQTTRDILVMRTDENGDSLWTRTYDGYGYNDLGRSVTEDSDGNIIVAGETTNYREFIGFLWYLDIEGNTIWSQEVNDSIGYSQMSVISLENHNLVTCCFSGYGTLRETTIYNFNNNYMVNWLSEFNGNPASGDKSIEFITEDGFICVLRDVDGNDNIGITKTDSQGQVTDISEDEIQYINNILLSNYPNPFNKTTSIEFSLQEDIRNPVIEIFNLKGQKIKQLFCINNRNSIIWDGTDQLNKLVSSGIYLYRIETDNGISKTNKMILTK